jgi:hypothetical protein
MKFILFNLILALAFVACKSSKEIPKNNGNTNKVVTDTVTIANEALDYEIIILEQGFERYLETKPNKEYYSITFLESKNLFYVQEYNRRVRDITVPREFYPQEINYDRNMHYGKEVNYLLYNYFRFFEQKYNQRLK